MKEKKNTTMLISKSGLENIKSEKIQYQAKINKELSFEEFFMLAIKALKQSS